MELWTRFMQDFLKEVAISPALTNPSFKVIEINFHEYRYGMRIVGTVLCIAMPLSCLFLFSMRTCECLKRKRFLIYIQSFVIKPIFLHRSILGENGNIYPES
jgi:hypothetical protein